MQNSEITLTKVIILGAGGHAKVVAEILRLSGKYDLIGLLDPALSGRIVGGLPVLGGDELLPRLKSEGVSAVFVGVGGIGDNMTRTKLFEKAISMGFTPINAIHPSAIISSSARVGCGVAIMARAVINSEAEIGDNVIINTGAVVEHDCRIEAHVHVSPGAILCGGVVVSRSAHIGAGAVIRQGINIGEFAGVGAGAVVIRDVEASTTVAGVPAHELPVNHKTQFVLQ